MVLLDINDKIDLYRYVIRCLDNTWTNYSLYFNNINSIVSILYLWGIFDFHLQVRAGSPKALDFWFGSQLFQLCLDNTC
jgi:hypothetical protein